MYSSGSDLGAKRGWRHRAKELDGSGDGDDDGGRDDDGLGRDLIKQRPRRGLLLPKEAT